MQRLDVSGHLSLGSSPPAFLKEVLWFSVPLLQSTPRARGARISIITDNLCYKFFLLWQNGWAETRLVQTVTTAAMQYEQP